MNGVGEIYPLKVVADIASKIKLIELIPRIAIEVETVERITGR